MGQPLPIDSCEPRPRDLIERIAAALPPQVRADYYREMAHCRILPETDEMLRILRAMQFLALLIEQAPGEVATEREKIAAVLEESTRAMGATQRAVTEYVKMLEDRIVQLPMEIGDGIRPDILANLISQDLRARFADIPQTVETLAGTSRQMKEAASEFQRIAFALTSSYNGIGQAAKTAIDELRTSVGAATTAAQSATKALTQKYSTMHAWTVAALCGAALFIGLAGGVLLDQWARPATEAVAAPARQVAPAAPAEPAAPALPAGKQRTPGVTR